MIFTDTKYCDLSSSLSDNFSNQIAAESQLHKLEKLLADKESEIKSLRGFLLLKEDELERIHNSRSWALLQFSRNLLVPSGSVRDKCARAVFRTGRRLFKKLATIVRQQCIKKPCKISSPDKYDLFIFSIINWDFRFQRPQQIARKFAQAGHRVFYLSQRFTGNSSIKVRQIEKNIFELSLAGDPSINIFKHQPSPYTLKKMVDSLHRFCLDNNCSTGVLLVQLPFWTSLAEELRIRFAWPIVYDCMDDHAGFTTNGELMLAMEQRLLEQADLIVTSSSLLEKKAQAVSPRVVLVRNAADYEHFASATAKVKVDGAAKVIIGYYGAIANWFDSDLVADLAKLQPDWQFQLVGNTFSADLNRLKKINNIELLGEQAYNDLPKILSTWDACIIPFRRVPLTESTNPVKIYEMLAAGMPVVSVDLPEVRSIAEAGLIRIAHNAGDFAEQLSQILREQSLELIKARRTFAQKNTWSDRYKEMNSAIISTFPKVSIIVVVHNNLELNKLCLSSILRKTDYPNYEVILVDNASTDGSREFALELSNNNSHVRVILNNENESFAKANNCALNLCSGDYVVFLNNDTIVTRGWITHLLKYLKNDPSIGMIGPVSNAVGNEAKIDVSYTSLDGIDDFAEQYSRKHAGETFEIPVLALFCAAIKRTLLENIGRLDERYDVGMFEDDDLCMRIKKAGFRLVCTEDVFIHHFQQGTFKLLDPEVYKRIFQANRQRFEEKWGPWQPHQYRNGLHCARNNSSIVSVNQP